MLIGIVREIIIIMCFFVRVYRGGRVIVCNGGCYL